MTIRDRLHRIITRKSASTSSSSSAGGETSTPAPGNPPSTTTTTPSSSSSPAKQPSNEPMSPAVRLLSKPLTWRPGHGHSGRLRPLFKHTKAPPDEDLSPEVLERLSRELSEAPNETLERYHHQAKLERYRLRFGGREGDVSGQRSRSYEDKISPCSSRPASLNASGALLPSSSAGALGEDAGDEDYGSSRRRRKGRSQGTHEQPRPGVIAEGGEGG
ncbi:hypothetical protein B0T22DRAFT_15659 [Podospora appendiculata]|uniref:Uncharacterized protein n=1 Tax=Podospora appendiculata TaxID=314037 RepID=A0AAE0XFM8_9PEZI|nr:hypothetical protein B0T22DRAFT_15659 [Podospora appendiculata]